MPIAVVFVDVVEPLIKIVMKQENNHKLAIMAIAALESLCKNSDECKGIFYQKNGIKMIKEKLF